MQIVINIEDRVYGLLKYFEESLGLADKKDDDVKTALIRAIVNGTPLPKGHGELVDYEELKNNARGYGAYAEAILSHIKPKTIIEADKKSEDKE